MMSQISIPTQDGSFVCSPSYKEAGELIGRNRKKLNSPEVSVDGSPLPELRQEIRSELNLGNSVVASGHQPEFYGPGPLSKELVLEKLSSRFEALNVLVDTDSTTEISFDVPLLYEDVHIYETMVLREYNRELSYCSISPPGEEELRGMNEKTLSRLSSLNSRTYYERVSDFFRQGGAGEKGASFPDWFGDFKSSYFENSFEEIKFSDLVETRAFEKYLKEIRDDYERFREIYNEILNEYRDEYGSFPAAILERGQVPFWLIDSEGVRKTAELSDLAEVGVSSGESFIAPKGLPLTMFCRVFLSDLFIHGIGGSKYSRATDSLMERFFGIEPPEVLVVSMTVHLKEELEAEPSDLAENDEANKSALTKRDYPFFLYSLERLEEIVERMAGGQNR